MREEPTLPEPQRSSMQPNSLATSAARDSVVPSSQVASKHNAIKPTGPNHRWSGSPTPRTGFFWMTIALTAIGVACSGGKEKQPGDNTGALTAPSASFVPAHAKNWDESEKAKAISEGKETLLKHQCNRCHTIDDLPAADRALTCTGCHVWMKGMKPGDKDYEKLKAKYGEEIIKRYQKNIEHLEHVPDLTLIARRIKPSWIEKYLTSPFDVRPALEEGMLRHHLSAAEISTVAKYFAARAGVQYPEPEDAAPTKPSDKQLEEGKQLFMNRACPSCHTLGNIQTGTTAKELRTTITSKLAPNLRFTKDRMHPSTLVSWIISPTSVSPTTIMPPLPLSKDDAQKIADFILWADPKLEPTPPPVEIKAPTILQRPVSYEEMKERTLGKVCVHCHMNDYERDPGPGNKGGLGYTGLSLQMRTYETLVSGAVDTQGKRYSVLEPAKGETIAPILLAMLKRRDEERRDRVEPFHDYERPAYTSSALGMPMGLPSMTDEELSILATWIAQGCEGPKEVFGQKGVWDGYLVPDGPIEKNKGCELRAPSAKRPEWAVDNVKVGVVPGATASSSAGPSPSASAAHSAHLAQKRVGSILEWLSVRLGVEGHGAKTLRLCSVVFTLSIGLAMMKAAQGGIFLSVYGREMIPVAFALSAINLAFLSAISVALAARLGTTKLASGTTLLSAIVFVFMRSVLVTPTSWGPILIYVLIEALSGVLVIQIWNVVADAVDPRSARSILPLVGTGGSLAWILSGVLTPALAKLVKAEGLLLVIPVVLLALGVLILLVGFYDSRGSDSKGDRSVGLIQGWRRGTSAVVQNPLLRLSATLSVLALVIEEILDYLMMSTVRNEITDATELSAFFGKFYGITSVLTLVLLLGASEKILSRLGSSRVLAFTPVATALASAAVLVFPSLMPAVLARGTDRILKQTLWSPSLEQTLTPVPSLIRTQSRALTRGVMAPLAYAFVGWLLALLPAGISLRWHAMTVVLLTMTSSIISITLVRSRYVQALRNALDSRRIDLLEQDTRGAKNSLEPDALSVLSEEVLSPDLDRALVAIELVRNDSRGVGVLERALNNQDTTVRAAALEGILVLPAATTSSFLLDHLKQENTPSLRRQIVMYLHKNRGVLPSVAPLRELCKKDLDESIRAISYLIDQEQAGDFAPLANAIAKLLRSDDPDSRRIALGAISPSVAELSPVVDALAELLSQSDEEIRLEVARTIANARITQALPHLQPLLTDPRMAPSVVAAVAPWEEARDSLLSQALQTSKGAVRERIGRSLAAAMLDERISPLPKSLVEPLLHEQIKRSYHLYSILGGIAHDDGVPDWTVEPEYQFLAEEIERTLREGQRHILQLLRLWESGRLLRAIDLGLAKPSLQLLAKVAELLEVSLEPALGRKVVPLFDNLSLRAKVDAAKKLELLDAQAFKDPLTAILALSDDHLRQCALLTYGPRFKERYPALYAAEQHMIPLFERMRLLRTVPLFADLNGEDLRILAESMTATEHLKGEVLFRKGDRGEDLLVVVEGVILVMDGGKELAKVKSREVIGELAVLDSEPRSADAVCGEAVKVLRLRGPDLAELMARRPQIQERIMMVVVRRLRDLTKKFAAQSGTTTLVAGAKLAR